MTTKYELTPAAVASVKAACDLIQIKAHKNKITANMAIGIANFASTKSYLSEKQHDWLLNNCSFLNIDLPEIIDQSEAASDCDANLSPLANSRAAQIIQIDKGLSTNAQAEIVGSFMSMTMGLLKQQSVLLTVSLL